MAIDSLSEVKTSIQNSGFVFDGFVSLVLGLRTQAPKAYTLIQLSPDNRVLLNTLQSRDEYLAYIQRLNPASKETASTWVQARRVHAESELHRFKSVLDAHLKNVDDIKTQVLDKIEAKLLNATEEERQTLLNLKSQLESSLNSLKSDLINTFEDIKTQVLQTIEEAKNALRF